MLGYVEVVAAHFCGIDGANEVEGMDLTYCGVGMKRYLDMSMCKGNF